MCLADYSCDHFVICCSSLQQKSALGCQNAEQALGSQRIRGQNFIRRLPSWRHLATAGWSRAWCSPWRSLTSPSLGAYDRILFSEGACDKTRVASDSKPESFAGIRRIGARGLREHKPNECEALRSHISRPFTLSHLCVPNNNEPCKAAAKRLTFRSCRTL